MVDAQLGRQRRDHFDETTRDHGDGEPEPLQGAHEGPGSRRQPDRGPHLVEYRVGQPGEGRHPGVQTRREIQFATHRRLGHGGHLGLAAGMAGEQLDDLVLDQGAVDIHDDEAPTPAGQARGRDGDIDTGAGRGKRDLATQRPQIGAGDVELDRGDGVTGEAPDPVDVGAVPGEPVGEQGHMGRPQR